MTPSHFDFCNVSKYLEKNFCTLVPPPSKTNVAYRLETRGFLSKNYFVISVTWNQRASRKVWPEISKQYIIDELTNYRVLSHYTWNESFIHILDTRRPKNMTLNDDRIVMLNFFVPSCLISATFRPLNVRELQLQSYFSTRLPRLDCIRLNDMKMYSNAPIENSHSCAWAKPENCYNRDDAHNDKVCPLARYFSIICFRRNCCGSEWSRNFLFVLCN